MIFRCKKKKVIDEPLFLMHHIDIMVSVTGSNLLQGFKESLLPSAVHKSLEEEDDDDDMASILQRLPPDTRPFEEFLIAAQGCLLLLMLKQHLKDQYGLTDAKITQYSPSEGAKVYEKHAQRKLITTFMPRPTLQAMKGIPIIITTVSVIRVLTCKLNRFHLKNQQFYLKKPTF